MTLALAVAVLLAATLFYTLFVRMKDIPAPEPVSPTQHLDERRAAIYENLRDLQFEYRVGKLSDADYAQTKLVLQKELAQVISETDRMMKGLPPEAAPLVLKKAAAAFSCPHCGAEFASAMRFCGQCGKEIA